MTNNNADELFEQLNRALRKCNDEESWRWLYHLVCSKKPMQELTKLNRYLEGGYGVLAYSQLTRQQLITIHEIVSIIQSLQAKIPGNLQDQKEWEDGLIQVIKKIYLERCGRMIVDWERRADYRHPEKNTSHNSTVYSMLYTVTQSMFFPRRNLEDPITATTDMPTYI